MASLFGRKVVGYKLNNSGGGVIKGDVLVPDTTADNAFTTTTSAAVVTGVWIADETIAAAATGRVVLSGHVTLVNVSASVTRGHTGTTHTVAKQAVSTGATTRTVGTFCKFTTGGTTPEADIWPVDLLGTSLSNPMTTKGDVILGDTGGTPTRLGAGTSGYVLTSAGAGAFPTWSASTGGITTDTYGTTTDGGTSDNPGARKMAVKKITVTTAGMLASIRGFVKGDATHGGSLAAFLLDDNAGVPGKVIAGGAFGEGAQVILSTTVRALDIPINCPVTATSYWIGWWWFDSAGALALRYVTTGPDYTQSASGTWAMDAGVGTGYAAATRDYSLSARVIR